MKKSSDYYRFMFLFSTGLRKFAYRKSFTRAIAQSPYFDGDLPGKTASNALSYLTEQGLLKFKQPKQGVTVYYLTGKGLNHLLSVLQNPRLHYPSNPDMVQFLSDVGLHTGQLPQTAYYPRTRDFLKSHEILCDDLCAWISAIGRPIVLVSRNGETLTGQICFAWCFTEREIPFLKPIEHKKSIVPDLLLFLNCRVGDQLFTKVAVMEVEVNTTDCVQKLAIYRQWCQTGGFRAFYNEQQLVFPLCHHRNPRLILGFIFANEAQENKAWEDLKAAAFSTKNVANQKVGQPVEKIGLSMVRTSHAGLDFSQDAWKSLRSKERMMLFW
jgi:hypothetical protein